MTNYFRVTAYHEKADVSVIIDSNGLYSALWELSAFLVKNGFQIIAVSKDGKFTDGNIPRAEYNAENIILRACSIGRPNADNGNINVHGRYYKSL